MTSQPNSASVARDMVQLVLNKDTNGNEIWFFWKATRQAATSDAESMKYQVLLASVVPANDPGDYQIIWPPEFVGKEIRDILTKEYDSPKK